MTQPQQEPTGSTGLSQTDEERIEREADSKTGPDGPPDGRVGVGVPPRPETSFIVKMTWEPPIRDELAAENGMGC